VTSRSNRPLNFIHFTGEVVFLKLQIVPNDILTTALNFLKTSADQCIILVHISDIILPSSVFINTQFVFYFYFSKANVYE